MDRVDIELLFRASSKVLKAHPVSDELIAACEDLVGGIIHYSQEGEDINLARLIGSIDYGFYVDIGAHHPRRFSNTYALYRRGWRGINIDATPKSMEPFKKIRQYDINLEIAISDKSEPLVFTLFKESALNTFDRNLAKAYTETGCRVHKEIMLSPRTLSEVLDQYVPDGQKIDLFSIDVEGEDLGVLRSNNWEKYSPNYIIIESLDSCLAGLANSPIVRFLNERGYYPRIALYNSIIFVSKHLSGEVSPRLNFKSES